MAARQLPSLSQFVPAAASWANAPVTPSFTSPRRGFRIRTHQLPPPLGATAAGAHIPPDLFWTESILAGSLGGSSANGLVLEEDGYFYEDGAINYAAPIPVFPQVYQGTLPEDATFPGLPSFGSSAYDNTALEITTFLEVRSAGTFRFQLNSGNILKVGLGHTPPEGLLSVTTPASVAGPVPAVPSASNDTLAIGVFGPLPQRPLEADLVPVVGTATNATPSQGCGQRLSNAEAVAGTIALVDRGGCSFLEKVRNAQAAGAIAVVVANDRVDHPIIMGGLPNELTLPAFMIRQTDGKRLRSVSGVRLRITPPAAGTLATRSFVQNSAATAFELQVGSPGRYPVRVVTQILTTPANLEWTVVPPEGESYLLNGPTTLVTAPVSAYAIAESLPTPAIRLHRDGPVLSVEYTGVLQSAPLPDGPFSDVDQAPVSGSHRIDPSLGPHFFRARW